MKPLPYALTLRLLAVVALIAHTSACAKTGTQDGASSASTEASSEAQTAPKPSTTTAPSTATTAPNSTSSTQPTTTTNTGGTVVAQPASKVQPVPWPNISFVNNPGLPGLNDTKAVALTFDDGPDGLGPVSYGKASPSNMAHVLDQLDALGVKATFFLCGKLWTDALNDKQAQADIQRMVTAGHAFGSHTYTHQYLTANTPRNVAAGRTPMTPAQVQAEFAQNEAVFADPRLLGPSRVPFTMYRAPYGNPFQDGIVYPPDANSIVDDVTAIAPYSPYNAVHVGWGIDTDDWQCAQGSNASACILANLNAFLDAGASGPILMHSVYQSSGDVLPQVVATIKSHGYHIVTVEDFIEGKYGASSADLYKANAASTFTAQQINDAAVAAAKQSKWYLRTNER